MVADGDASDDHKVTLHEHGAFGRFKGALQRRGIADQWYRYRDATREEIAVEFFQAHGVDSAVNHGKNEQNPCRLPLSRRCLAVSRTLTSRNSRGILQPIWI